MKNNFIEIIVGACVLIFAAIFVVFAYEKAEFKTKPKGVYLTAKFGQADGISIGSDIKIAGVKVGTVSSYKLDADKYEAVVGFYIDKDLKLSKDSSAQIVSDGLLGGKYISLSPGAEEENLGQNDEIKYTQSSVNIENLIGKMVFSSDNK